MNTAALTKIIVALIILLILSIIGLVVVGILKNDEDKNPDVTDNSDVTTTQKADDNTTTVDDVTTIDDVTTKTDGEVTTKTGDETTKKDDETTKKEDETTSSKPKQSAPANFTYSKTIKGDSGYKYFYTNLELKGTRNDDGTVHLVASLYLVHYNIEVGGLKSYIKIGNNGANFSAPAIKLIEEDQKKTTTLLGTYECDVYYGESVTVGAYYGYTAKYGGVKINGITTDTKVTIK